MVRTDNRDNNLVRLSNTMYQEMVDLLLVRTNKAIDLCLGNVASKLSRTRIIQLRGQYTRLEACREEWDRLLEVRPDQRIPRIRVMEQVVAPGEQFIMVIENTDLTNVWSNMLQDTTTISDQVIANPLNMRAILGRRMSNYETEIYTNIKARDGDNRFIINDFTTRILSELIGNNGEIEERNITNLIYNNMAVYKRYYKDLKPIMVEIMSCLVERGAYYVPHIYNMILRLLEIELEAERDYLPSDKIIDLAEGSWFRDYMIAYQLFREINGGAIEEHAVKMSHCYYSLLIETSSNKKVKQILKEVEKRQRYDFELPLIAPRCRNCFHVFYREKDDEKYCSRFCKIKDHRRDIAIRSRKQE